MKSESVTVEMIATKQYFCVVPLIILYKAVLTFEFVQEGCTCLSPPQSIPVLQFLNVVILCFNIENCVLLS